jgi:hypothetical protein
MRLFALFNSFNLTKTMPLVETLIGQYYTMHLAKEFDRETPTPVLRTMLATPDKYLEHLKNADNARDIVKCCV